MPKEVCHNWYTQNEDHPEINDESSLEFADGILTVGSNEELCRYRVEGQAPTVEDFRRVEEKYGDYPVCSEDPRYVLEILGLTLVERVED